MTADLTGRDAHKTAHQGSPQSKAPAAASSQHTPAGIIEDFILENLAYSSMRSREEEVTEAHRATLEWIFHADETLGTSRQVLGSQFMQWLTTDTLGPIYWITGKPGSGKSTLMRFLFQHKATAEKLQLWAGTNPVTVAGFFFWISGSREQRSQTGLLRYLLFQMLSAHRTLIEVAFPALWQQLQAMTTKERILHSIEWKVTDLMQALRSFLDVALQSANVCIFVDGLDEFDGDHQAMVTFFKGLSEMSGGKRIKLCLSSRPWDVFEKAFDRSVPSMRVQDLTHGDMAAYAQARLHENAFVRGLCESRAEDADTLVEETVSRADGIFLWIRIAIDKMLQAFGPDDSLDGLAETLRSLPMRLEDLFEKLIFRDRVASQVAETGILFQLIRGREVVADFVRDESANSLTVWELAFALDDGDDALALQLPVQEASDADIQIRSRTTSAHVYKSFAGLVDLYTADHGAANMRSRRFLDETVIVSQADRTNLDKKLLYIHRTVRDWLMSTDGMMERLSSNVPHHFDPHLRLLRSYILRLKQPLTAIEHHRRLNDWWPDIVLAMTHARHIHRDILKLQRRFVNELDKTLSWYWIPRTRDPGDHWARSAFGSYEVRMKAVPIRDPFLCLAAKFGLTQYLCSELEARHEDQPVLDKRTARGEGSVEPGSAPLLAYATEFLCSRNKTVFPLSDPALVSYLLRHPSSTNPGPNHPYLDFVRRFPLTPWVAVLRHLRDARRRGWIKYYDVDPEGTARWAGIVDMFIRVGGADAGVIVKSDSFDPEISAVGVLQLLEDTYGAVEVRDLKSLLARLSG